MRNKSNGILPSATEWESRNINDWNATTFRSYLQAKHEELYGIPYVTRNYAMEAGMIKKSYEEYGKDVTKAFIDACFSDYKPTKQYPSLNYAFMYSYMRNRILPRLLAEQAKDRRREERKERRQEVDYEAIAELL